MIFLINFNRTKGKILSITIFDDSDRENANNERLNLELNYLTENNDNEIILLYAKSENDLRQTHRRYFEDLENIAST